MMRLALAAAALTLIAGTCQAQAYRDPARSWFSGFGQGIIEAGVRNNNGAELRFVCPGGTDLVKPSISLSLTAGGPASSAENLDVVFEIDGVGHDWTFHRRGSDADPVEYFYEAFNWRVEIGQARLAEKLRTGTKLIVFVPQDRVMQEFSLVGSAEALEGCAGG